MVICSADRSRLQDVFLVLTVFGLCAGFLVVLFPLNSLHRIKDSEGTIAVGTSINPNITTTNNQGSFRNNLTPTSEPERARNKSKNGVMSVNFSIVKQFLRQVKNDTEKTGYCSVYNLAKPLATNYKCLDIRLRHFANKGQPKICIYDVPRDIHVSGSIARNGAWESAIVSQVMDKLVRMGNAGLLDIGANIGMYTIPVAKLGFKVVAVEPNLESVRRIQKAAQLSGVTQNITLVNNGISNERTVTKLRLSRNNQGDTRVSPKGPCRGNCGHNITTILMDDLLEVITFKTAIMKIDIQSYEHKAFAHAEKLFNATSIPIIYMEWEELAKYYVSARQASPDKTMVLNLIKMLVRRGYTAYRGLYTTPKLDVKRWQTWPVEIVWLKERNF